MSAVVLREFLISLGFSVDSTSNQNFNTAIKDTTKTVAKLAAVAETAALAVYAATIKMSDGLEKLYFASQRTGASVESLKAIGYAASQMGSSVQDATSSLESLSHKLRTNPGYGALANSLLGGKANLQDSSVLLGQLAERFKTMPYYLANAYAEALGISESTLRAMLAGIGEFSAEYKSKLKTFGVDMEAAAASGRRFMISVRQVQSSIDMLWTKIGAPFADRLAISFKAFDKFLANNSGAIVQVITKALNFILAMADIISRIVYKIVEGGIRLVKWFESLSGPMQRVVEGIGVLIVAWKLLNSAFVKSPLGFIILLTAAFLLLLEDYQTWKDKGESLIDWEKWEPSILKAQQAFKDLGKWIEDLGLSTTDVEHIFEGLLAFIAGRWALGMIGAFTRVGVSMAPILAGLLAMGVLFAGAKDIYNRGLFGNIPDSNAEMAGLGRAPNEARPAQSKFMNWLHRTRDFITGGKTEVGKDMPDVAGPLLDGIAAGESNGYDELYNGKKFTDFSKHPNQPQSILSGPHKGEFSSAAGRYQFLKGTWDTAAKALNLKDFSPASQDAAAWWLAKTTYKQKTGGDLEEALRSQDPKVRSGIGPALAGQWTSLPGGIEPNGATGGFNRAIGAGGATSASGSDDWRQSDGLNRRIQAGTSLGSSSGNNVAINQSTTIQINGAGDPVAVGGAVAQTQGRVNADLTRNMQGAVR